MNPQAGEKEGRITPAGEDSEIEGELKIEIAVIGRAPLHAPETSVKPSAS